MKLYTEEQMIEAFKYGQNLEGFDWIGDMIDSLDAIELPSDEEINTIAMGLYGFKATSVKDVLEYKAFKRGAKLVINKIQGGNK